MCVLGGGGGGEQKRKCGNRKIGRFSKFLLQYVSSINLDPLRFNYLSVVRFEYFVDVEMQHTFFLMNFIYPG